jgi:hypothetical protein
MKSEAESSDNNICVGEADNLKRVINNLLYAILKTESSENQDKIIEGIFRKVKLINDYSLILKPVLEIIRSNVSIYSETTINLTAIFKIIKEFYKLGMLDESLTLNENFIIYLETKRNKVNKVRKDVFEAATIYLCIDPLVVNLTLALCYESHATVSKSLGEWGRAREYHKKIYYIAPESYLKANDIIEDCIYLRRFGEAEAFLKKIPDSTIRQILYFKYCIYLKNCNHLKLLKDINKFEKDHAHKIENLPITFKFLLKATKSWIYVLSNRYLKAIKALGGEEIFWLSPILARALLNIYLHFGKYKEAAELLEMVRDVCETDLDKAKYIIIELELTRRAKDYDRIIPLTLKLKGIIGDKDPLFYYELQKNAPYKLNETLELLESVRNDCYNNEYFMFTEAYIAIFVKDDKKVYEILKRVLVTSLNFNEEELAWLYQEFIFATHKSSKKPFFLDYHKDTLQNIERDLPNSVIDEWVLLAKGLLLWILGIYDMAKLAFKAAIDYNPSNNAILKYLGYGDEKDNKELATKEPSKARKSISKKRSKKAIKDSYEDIEVEALPEPSLKSEEGQKVILREVDLEPIIFQETENNPLDRNRDERFDFEAERQEMFDPKEAHYHHQLEKFRLLKHISIQDPKPQFEWLLPLRDGSKIILSEYYPNVYPIFAKGSKKQEVIMYATLHPELEIDNISRESFTRALAKCRVARKEGENGIKILDGVMELKSKAAGDERLCATSNNVFYSRNGTRLVCFTHSKNHRDVRKLVQHASKNGPYKSYLHGNQLG